MDAGHACAGSRRHCHQTRRLDPARTSRGDRSPFWVGCHSWLSAECDSAKDASFEARRCAQYGQSVCRRVRSRMLARHSWLAFEQRHHAIRVEAAITSLAATSPFRTGCHSAARRGKHVSRLLVSDTFRFVQNGQPVPSVLLFGVARHEWSLPRRHFHQILRPDPAGTVSGVRMPLRSASHS
jgi:hypothetical protein